MIKKQDFIIYEIANTNIVIGKYPTCKEDMGLLKEYGITACLDLLSERDI